MSVGLGGGFVPRVSRRSFVHGLLGLFALSWVRFSPSARAAVLAAAAATGADTGTDTSLGAGADTRATTGGLAIVQGMTDATSTQIGVLVPAGSEVSYVLTASDGSALGGIHHSVKRFGLNPSAWVVDQSRFEGLKSGTGYLLQVKNMEGKVLDEREFETLDLARPMSSMRLALVSCMWDQFDSVQKKIWPVLSSKEPDLIYFLGDNVYAGFLKALTPIEVWEKYVESRRKLVIFRQRKLIPSLAIWDDHDYGQNNAGHEYIHKAGSRNVFNAFWPQEAVEGALERGPGVSSHFRAFGQHFVFTDGRYFRNSPGKSGRPSLWGAEQEDWIERKIMDGVASGTTSEPIWLLNGTQFAARSSNSESFGKNFPESYAAWMRFAGSLGSPMVFVSGDVHFTEISRVPVGELPYRSYEITSSSMHSTQPAVLPRNPNRVKGTNRHNFVVLEGKDSQGDEKLALLATAYDKDGGRIFSERLGIGGY